MLDPCNKFHSPYPKILSSKHQVKFCQDYRGYFSGNSGYLAPEEPGSRKKCRESPVGRETEEDHSWAKHIWVVGFCGLSGYLDVYLNALGKLPMSLHCHCTWP